MTPTPDPILQTRVVRGPRTWGVIQDRYIAGETAASLAEIFSVKVETIRKRASRGSWRKADLPDPPPLEAGRPAGWDAFAPDADATAPCDLRSATRRLLGLALDAAARGQLKLAADCARVAESASRTVFRLDGRGGPDPDNPILEPAEDVLITLSRMLEEMKAKEEAEAEAEALSASVSP